MSIWDDPPESYVGGWEGHFYFPEATNFFGKLFGKVLGKPSWSEVREAIKPKLLELCQKKVSINVAKARWSQQETDLGGYTPYVPVMDIDLGEASHEVAECELNRRIEQQDARIKELQKLVLPWGILLDGDGASIDALELWFTTYVQFFTKQEALAHIKENKVATCNPYYHRVPLVWYSIALDISLYLSAMLQSACPNVYWTVNKVKKPGDDMRYNRPVLKYTASSDAYFFYEGDIWDLLRLYNKWYAPSFHSWLNRAYKKNLTTCYRLAKK